jgi:hypothetical protein
VLNASTSLASVRIPPIVIVIVILILFPRRYVAEKVGYLAMRCILIATALVPILWAIFVEKH